MLGISGPWEWIIIMFILMLPVIFLWRILSKAGYSGAWALFAFFPPLLFVILAFLAFANWPNLEKG